MSALEAVAAAVRAGRLVVIPTDTVYGLACTPYREEPARRLSELKGRSPEQPIALVAADVDRLVECVPELRGKGATAARALLPGPFTLVVPNPAGRFPWLTGNRPGTIGVRVPELSGSAAELLDALGAVAATSANLHGGADPRTVADVPAEILDAVAAVLDAGELGGVPSTVVDLTGDAPQVVREGAVPAGVALARVHDVLGQ